MDASSWPTARLGPFDGTFIAGGSSPHLLDYAPIVTGGPRIASAAPPPQCDVKHIWDQARLIGSWPGHRQRLLDNPDTTFSLVRRAGGCATAILQQLSLPDGLAACQVPRPRAMNTRSSALFLSASWRGFGDRLLEWRRLHPRRRFWLPSRPGGPLACPLSRSRSEKIFVV